ncbi:MAG: polysaccharide deacetylase family protein [Bacteroidetes bacterium]|nr:polysaccharide deacetylase family protein [Bacteroidota bacterium]
MNLRIPILIFHRISPYPDGFWSPLTPKQFESHIKFLSKKYRFISLNNLFDKKKEQLRDCCAVVFDDAFKDFHEHALPIIKKHQVPVTMFVPVDCVNKNQIIWTSQLDNCFKFTNKTELCLNINNEQIFLKLESEKQRSKAAFAVRKLLIRLPDKQRRIYVSTIMQTLGYKDDTNANSMSWSEIKETLADVKYESHSMTHPALSMIEDEATLDYELYESKNLLTAKLENNVDYIAYPAGNYSGRVLHLVLKYYKAGFAVNNELVDLKKVNDTPYKYAIPRFNVHDKNPYELFFRINGFHKFIRK